MADTLLTSLKRVGQSNYNAMLLTIASPPGWSKRTLLLRFTEESGKQTVFVVTGDEAIKGFETCEKGRIYDMVIPGKCVKQSDCTKKYGVANTQEVHLQYPCKIQLSKTAWSAPMKYNFVDWSSLNQKTPDTFVDLVGRVVDKPIIDSSASIPKMLVQLGFDDMQQTVSFLGEHTSVRLAVGDVVVMGGVCIKEWRKERTLQTTFTTVIDVNPSTGADMPPVPETSTGPKKKALRMSEQARINAAEVDRLEKTLMAEAESGRTVLSQDFALIGYLAKFEDKFFDCDPPILGADRNEKICWSTTFSDVTGVVPVRVWDKPCFELLHMTAPKMRACWEKGVTHEDQRTTLLAQLNQNLDREVRLSCTANVWSYGSKNKQHQFQVNVNLAEFQPTQP